MTLITSMTLIKQFADCEDATSAVEYSLIAGLISIAIIVGATAVSSALSVYFSKLAAALR